MLLGFFRLSRSQPVPVAPGAAGQFTSSSIQNIALTLRTFKLNLLHPMNLRIAFKEVDSAELTYEGLRQMTEAFYGGERSGGQQVRTTRLWYSRRDDNVYQFP